MKTEDEAKTKWCPFATSAALPDSHPNGGRIYDTRGDSMGFTACIASDCMAWREAPYHDTRDKYLWSKSKQARVSGAHSDDAEWRLENPDEPEPPREGYCGLAGKPS